MAKRKPKYTPSSNSSHNTREQMLERAQSMLSEEGFSLLQHELSQPLSTAIRANPFKVEPSSAILEWSKRYQWQVREVPYCSSGWWITPSSTPVSQPIEHRLGYYYIQDAASMLPVELFNFNDLEQPLILDMAASPGGKTTHLIDRSLDGGLVLANDSSQERIKALRLVLQNWGTFNHVVTCFPGEMYGLWFPETFDRILLDAPCSMQNLRSSEAHPVRSISVKERDALATRQKRLLNSAFQALKLGGEVVYSTCTLNPEENEAVLDDLLRRYPDAAQIVDVQARLPGPAPALGCYETQVYDSSVQGAARLWPHCFGTSGFFAALITKTSTLARAAQPHPQASPERAGFAMLSSSESAHLARQFCDQYGFDLADTMLNQGTSLWQRGEAVFALPERWLEQFPTLPVRAAGMLIMERMTYGLLPSHEFVARFGTRFQAGYCILPEACIEGWMNGEDLRTFSNEGYSKGAILVVRDEIGRLMGRGKVTAGGLKNLLPRRLVYT